MHANHQRCQMSCRITLIPNLRFRSPHPQNPRPTPGGETRPNRDSAREPRHRRSYHPNKGVDRKVADLYEKGQVCPHAHYFSGDPQVYQNFCREFNIPTDVMLYRMASDRIKDKAKDRPKHFNRELMAWFSLAPHQLAINSYRIIMSVIALKEGPRKLRVR